MEHSGKYYAIKNYAVQIPIRQKPYPPLWYPTGNPDTAPWLGLHAMHTVTWPIGPTRVTNCVKFLSSYAAELREHAGDSQRLNAHVTDPRSGFMQHVFAVIDYFVVSDLLALDAKRDSASDRRQSLLASSRTAARPTN